MSFKPPVPKEVKEEILKKVKEGRVSVLEAATQHGLSPRTIHDWLAHQITGDGLPQENARLKKENQELYELLGRVSAELERSKKKNSSS